MIHFGTICLPIGELESKTEQLCTYSFENLIGIEGMVVLVSKLTVYDAQSLGSL